MPLAPLAANMQLEEHADNSKGHQKGHLEGHLELQGCRATSDCQDI